MRFEKAGVHEIQRKFFSIDRWTARYSDFRGIALDRFHLDTRYDRRDFFVVLLVHDEPDGSIPMLITQHQPNADDAFPIYARHFGLKTLTPVEPVADR